MVNFEADEFVASTNPEYPIRITSKNKVSDFRRFFDSANREV